MERSDPQTGYQRLKPADTAVHIPPGSTPTENTLLNTRHPNGYGSTVAFPVLLSGGTDRPMALATSPTATLPPELRLTHLKQLEAEAIHIIREVVTQFEKPVMLYSIGKDSSVLLHLARKAFSPGKIPFPLLHVNTTWKFRR